MLKFKLVLPPATASDVVSQEITCQVADGEPTTQTVGVSETDVFGFEGADGATVTTTLVQIDDAGNRSEPRVQTFTLLDTIPPAQPGEVGLVVTAEV